MYTREKLLNITHVFTRCYVVQQSRNGILQQRKNFPSKKYTYAITNLLELSLKGKIACRTWLFCTLYATAVAILPRLRVRKLHSWQTAIYNSVFQLTLYTHTFCCLCRNCNYYAFVRCFFLLRNVRIRWKQNVLHSEYRIIRFLQSNRR